MKYRILGFICIAVMVISTLLFADLHTGTYTDPTAWFAVGSMLGLLGVIHCIQKVQQI